MPYCDACLDDCPPYDPETGLCFACQELLEERRKIDAMTSEQYDAFMAARDANAPFHAIKNWKLAS